MEALGDVVCCLPLCDAARKKHPGRAILFVTSLKLRRLVGLSSAADGVYGSTSSDFNVRRGYMRLIEAVYSIETIDNISDAGSTDHLVDTLAASCGFEIEDRQPRLNAPQRLVEHTRKKFQLLENRPIIVVNPGPTWPVRNWSADHWQKLINELSSRYDAEIVQVGMKRRTVSSPYDDLQRVHQLASRLRVDELVALIAMSRLVISIDSGPIHVAGAVGTPVIGLFGAVDPALRLPPDSPGLGLHADVPCLFCHHKTPIGHWKDGCPNDIQCMSKLMPDTVLEAVERILGTTVPRRTKIED